MKKEKLIVLAVVVFLFLSVPAIYLNAIVVTPSTGPYRVGDVIGFRPTSSVFSTVNVTYWDFGDGVSTTTNGMSEVNHSYSAAGSYTVRVSTSRLNRFGPSVAPTTESLTIRIEAAVDNRYITVEPVKPVVGQPATFRAFNFNTPQGIVWDMGDGTILDTARRTDAVSSGPPGVKGGITRPMYMGNRLSRPSGTDVVTHTYTSPGRYTVRAYDFYGDTNTPVTLIVNVELPQRSITYSPSEVWAGAPVQFNAVNFLSDAIDWNFGDGTIVSAGISTTHIYNDAGIFTVTARESNTNYNPVSIRVTVTMPNRLIRIIGDSHRVDEPVEFRARNFITNSFDWNFGDGTIITGGDRIVFHRYMTAGTFTVSAKESTINHAPVTNTVTILPENRYITVSPPEARTNEPITVQAFNFRGDYILWDFGDGTQLTGMHTETHAYTRSGTYTITARDENGESQVPFTAQVVIKGIDDVLNLEIAEVRLDNGKYYKVISKNSKNIQAVLRMKMRGSGIIAGHWEVDGHPYEFFSETVSQGLLKEIYTHRVPGLPTIDPGIHSVTVRLTRPVVDVRFPVLKYFVLPYENTVKTVSPPDKFVAKEKEIPEFSWEEAKGANKYQIVFSDVLYSIMTNAKGLNWIDTETALTFTPGEGLWNGFKRNRWTYWKVRALNTFGEVVAESDIQDIKVVIATAKITINRVTDLEGHEIEVDRGNIRTRANDLMVYGSVEYLGDSEYLVLRVYSDRELCDQLLFRDVKKGETRSFETSIPHRKSESRIYFQVLKTSSPSVLIGIQSLVLKK